MAIKVKELKDDTIISIDVNKSYYLMLKEALYYLFTTQSNDDIREESLKKIMTGDYNNLNDWEKTFYTITLALTEIERKAVEGNAYNEKEILEPGDEGYVEPTVG
jgi:hypothetical protein